MQKTRIIGLMSGTSLDGLDLAYCEFTYRDHHWSYELLECREIPYDVAFKKRLQEAIHLSEDDLEIFNQEYGSWLGECVQEFVREKELKIDAVASHGHTIHHRPEDGFTYQLGDGDIIAKKVGVPVIYDFRTLDIELGGQGAPLVPIGDALLFSQYDFCLNIGGISNISFELNGHRTAFDIGIANMLLNYLSEKVGMAYDKGGALAKKGNLDENLLNGLNALEFYSQKGPKSLGYEWFCAEVVPLVEKAELSVEDLLCTGTHHLAYQIIKTLKEFPKSKASVLVSGGGAFNDYLIELLRKELKSDFHVVVPDATLISYKEALIFAFMGVLRLAKKNNVLASVTGASRDSSSGRIAFP